MRLKSLAGALLAVFIIVANDNGLFGDNEHRTKSEIQQDQVNNPAGESGKAPSAQTERPFSSAYPPLPE